jgi:hypothetical protein
MLAVPQGTTPAAHTIQVDVVKSGAIVLKPHARQAPVQLWSTATV